MKQSLVVDNGLNMKSWASVIFFILYLQIYSNFAHYLIIIIYNTRMVRRWAFIYTEIWT